MTISPRFFRVAAALVVGVLTVGCKTDDAPAAQQGTAPEPTPVAAADAGGDAVEPQGDAKAQGDTPTSDSGSKKSGLASLTKGLLDEAKGAPKDPLALVPVNAVLVASVQVSRLALVPGWDDAKIALLADVKDGARMLEAFKACQIDLDQTQAFTFAAVEGKKGLALIQGPGFGKLANHECTTEKLRAAGVANGYTLTDHEGEKRIVTTDGETYGYLASDDLLVLVDKEIDAKVAELRAGKGKSVMHGELKATIDRIGTDKHAWFAARVVDFVATEMGTTPLGAIHEMWGTAHFDTDLALTFGTRMPDAAAATAMRDTTQRSFDEMKAMLPMLGLPASVSSKVTIGATDDRFTVDVAMTTAELSSIRDAIKRM